MATKDNNRYRKIYRYIRRKPSMSEDANVIVESTTISFENTDTGSHNFTKLFTSAPYVTATAFDSEGNQSANVNVFITAVTTSAVTIKTSAPFTGQVHIQAIQNLIWGYNNVTRF